MCLWMNQNVLERYLYELWRALDRPFQIKTAVGSSERVLTKP